MTSAPSHASASVHEVPASNWVRSRTFTSSSAVFCNMVTLLSARTVQCLHTAHITRCLGPALYLNRTSRRFRSCLDVHMALGARRRRVHERAFPVYVRCGATFARLLRLSRRQPSNLA